MKMMVRDNLQGLSVIDEKGEKELSKYKVGKVINVKITEKRTLDQNALAHKWFGIIAKAQGETPLEVKNYCKLHYAVPILRAEDPVFNGFFKACIKDLTYEQQLKSMAYISATSRMSTKQLRRCLDHIQKVYAEQGIVLTNEKED